MNMIFKNWMPNVDLADGYCFVYDKPTNSWVGQDVSEYGTTLLAGTQITDITNGDVWITYTKYNTKYIQIIGTIPANTTRYIYLPFGCWIITCQDVIFNHKSQLQAGNDTNTGYLTSGVHLLSITQTSLAVL